MAQAVSRAGNARRRPARIAKHMRILKLVAVIVALFVVGFLDYVTGWELSFFVFYFLPVTVGAWILGPRIGYLLSVVAALVWFLSDHLSGHPYSRTFYPLWNLGIRLFAFLFVAGAIANLRTLLLRERAVSEALRDALAHVKVLRGLIPICASCKKVRNDKGFWQSVEEYVLRHSEAQFTHGLCQVCAEKMLRDAGLDPAAVRGAKQRGETEVPGGPEG